MNFLTDENIEDSIFLFIQGLGFNVKDIKKEKLYGIDDNKILEIAMKENRIIITHDKDFANLVCNKNHKGIILIKSKIQNTKGSIELLNKLFQSNLKDKINGSLVILSDDKIIIKDNKYS